MGTEMVKNTRIFQFGNGVFRLCALAWVCVFLLPGGGFANSVVINEIMYNPVDGQTPVDGNQYEFVELFNDGVGSVDLTDAYFSSGITYTFTNSTVLAQGAYLVVVKNRTAFTNRYPGVAIADGFYTGSLGNGGEKVTLKDSGNSTLHSVDYDDENGWPVRPDGYGSSLTLIDPQGDADAPANWCSSDVYLGTPGATGVCAQGDIAINEVIAHTDPPLEDAIELKNLTGSPIDISGWYLSDDPGDRKKFEIPNGTTLPANGYHVFYEEDFGSGGSGPTSFALSELGDDVYLTAADGGGNLTRFVDFTTFGASDNGVSFGRYPDGSGTLVTMSAHTFGVANPVSLAQFRTGTGAVNALPLVGPIVISEIMYHPPNDNSDDEYLELLNVTTGAVDLFDAAFPSNTWRVGEAVEYTLPTNISLASGARLLLVGTTNTALFRATHGIDPGVAVLGAWTGRLNNAGESVHLFKPGTPETNLVPYILVEQVDYLDDIPWPLAPDGNGPSLERLVTTNYGNMASNWFAGPPGGTPGDAPLGGLIDPVVTPATPAPGNLLTVTVAIVASTLPTQVVTIVAVSGSVTTNAMNDGGTGGDAVSGDQRHTAVVSGPGTADWVYYRFEAFGAGGESVSLPAPSIGYIDAPTITVRNSGGGLLSTVQPEPGWVSVATTGLTTHAAAFYAYLDGAGLAYVDDVSVIDTATHTEHVRNGSFTNFDHWSANGNHSSSGQAAPFDEGGNGVLKLEASAAGSGSANSAAATLSPSMSVGTEHVLRFRARLQGVEVPEWFSLGVGSVPPDVVISEIMYHPIETNDIGYDYVEIFNPHTASVDLSDWRLDGVDFDLPGSTSITGGGYLVLCASQTVVHAKYGIVNTVGNWLGSLRNSMETLRLVNDFGREIDRVDYEDNEPWPAVADGYGPSLERLNALAIGSNSCNWSASSPVTNWQHLVWTSVIGVADAPLNLFVDFEGKCWVDDVSVKLVGSGTELVSNGDFASGFTGWVSNGSHSQSRVEDAVGVGGSAGLALVGNLTRMIDPSLDPSLSVTFGSAASNYVRQVALGNSSGGSYIISIQIRKAGIGGAVHVVSGNASNTLWLGHEGTPGLSNSVSGPLAPFGIKDLNHEFNLVSTGVANVVRALINDTGLVSSVTFCYRAFGTNEYEFSDAHYDGMAMLDDGLAPDTIAGDGEYAAAVPTFWTNWTFVRYHIEATDVSGNHVRAPHRDDPSLDEAFLVQSSSVQSNMPNWQIFSEGHPVLYPHAVRACVIGPDFESYTDVRYRHRGNPTQTNDRSSVALRFHRSRPVDLWFAKNEDGINFRIRKNDSSFWYKRIIHEWLGYAMQRKMGFPTPRVRHVCMWRNGSPTITMSLEAPGEAFAVDHDLSLDDYLSRAGYTGRRAIAGDSAINNYDFMHDQLRSAVLAAKNDVVRTNLVYESARHSMALLSLTANSDQAFNWNMFQHRRASDGRWQQFPWDVDFGFNPTYTNMHPYHETPLHPSAYGATNRPLGVVLFYPESGSGASYTVPYRYRHQKTLWRHVHTMLTTNSLYPMLKNLEDFLIPSYNEINVSIRRLTNKVQEVRHFILHRREFYLNGGWSDRDAAAWAGIYDPSTVVINEIMYDPSSGGEYLELYNTGTQTIDLSQWTLQSGEESYRLPFGSMLGPTSYLVVADTQLLLTNVYLELSSGTNMVERYPGYDVWDWPLLYTSRNEHVSRVIEESSLTLPNEGATVVLLDLCTNVIDSVTYSNGGTWPNGIGYSLELADATADNNLPGSWQSGQIVGTPGVANTAVGDVDDDDMPDSWEQQVVDASGGGFTNVTQVLPGDNFDGDALTNEEEFLLGSDPTVEDDHLHLVDLIFSNGAAMVGMMTFPATGTSYRAYSGRYYSFERAAVLGMPTAWGMVPEHIDVLGMGGLTVYTNATPTTNEFYRGAVDLKPLRP
jgi:hypothetical protein